jgi:hypothetical protein
VVGWAGVWFNAEGAEDAEKREERREKTDDGFKRTGSRPVIPPTTRTSATSAFSALRISCLGIPAMRRRVLWPVVLAAALGAGCVAVGLGPLLAGGKDPSLPAAPKRPCETGSIPKSVTRSKDAYCLNIPDRDHDPGHPKEGWCGETAIQEALLYHGAYFPQKVINKAGKPAHADLYAQDIPVALKGLGAAFEWSKGQRRLSVFLGWIRTQIKAGVPVFAGVKIHPTKHPEWGLDHFVLVVGFDKKSFTFNTTWGRRMRRTVEQVGSTKKGYAFANRYNAYYALRITGPAKRAKGEVPVRLFAAKETKKALDVIVKCERLTPGATYVLSKSPAFNKPAAPFAAFKAPAATYAFHATLDKSKPAVYRCRKK